MSYTVFGPPMSVARAEEFGKWLAKYKVEIAGLSVWQIGASGRRYRDSAAMDTIMTAGGYVGAGVAGAPVGAAGAAMGCGPLLGVILTPIMPYLVVFELVMIPVSLGQQYKLRKKDGEPMLAVATGDPIVETEIKFGLTGVSAQRIEWTTYLIGCYGALHQWRNYKGFAHPKQLTAGATYAMRMGACPPAWSDRSREASIRTRYRKNRRACGQVGARLIRLG